MQMTFGRMNEPLTKVQKVDSTRTAQSYDFTYRYEDDSHPTAPTQVGHDHYTYDANGNPILVENDSLNTERIVKSHGDLEGVYINGAPQGISFHETEDYTIYPALRSSLSRRTASPSTTSLAASVLPPRLVQAGSAMSMALAATTSRQVRKTMPPA